MFGWSLKSPVLIFLTGLLKKAIKITAAMWTYVLLTENEDATVFMKMPFALWKSTWIHWPKWLRGLLNLLLWINLNNMTVPVELRMHDIIAQSFTDRNLLLQCAYVFGQWVRFHDNGLNWLMIDELQSVYVLCYWLQKENSRKGSCERLT